MCSRVETFSTVKGFISVCQRLLIILKDLQGRTSFKVLYLLIFKIYNVYKNIYYCYKYNLKKLSLDDDDDDEPVQPKHSSSYKCLSKMVSVFVPSSHQLFDAIKGAGTMWLTGESCPWLGGQVYGPARSIPHSLARVRDTLASFLEVRTRLAAIFNYSVPVRFLHQSVYGGPEGSSQMRKPRHKFPKLEK